MNNHHDYNLVKILDETKQLADRLKDRDKSADGLIKEATCNLSRLHTMLQYQDKILHLSKFTGDAASDSGISSNQSSSGMSPLTAELNPLSQNKRLGELRHENAELREALADYQLVLEMVMSKYRRQISDNLHGPKANTTDPVTTTAEACEDQPSQQIYSDQERNLEEYLIANLIELSRIADETSEQQDCQINQLEDVMNRLAEENGRLRIILTAVSDPASSEETLLAAASITTNSSCCSQSAVGSSSSSGNNEAAAGPSTSFSGEALGGNRTDIAALQNAADSLFNYCQIKTSSSICGGGYPGSDSDSLSEHSSVASDSSVRTVVG